MGLFPSADRIAGAVTQYFRWDLYRRLLPYLRPYRWTMVVVTVMQLAYAVLRLADPWPMKVLIDHGLSGQEPPAWLAPVFSALPSQAPIAIVLFAIVGGLVVSLVKNVIDVWGEYIKAGVNRGMILAFQVDMFGHLQRLSFSYHDRTTVGDSIYRVSTDSTFISTLIWSNFRHLMMAIVTFVGMLWILLELDWVLAVVALSLGPVQFIAIGFYGKLFKVKSKNVRAMESTFQSIIEEVLSGLKVVKAFGQEEREQRKFEEHGRAAVRARLRLESQRQAFSYGLEWFGTLNRVVITLIGAFHVVQGQLTIGELFVIQNYVGQLQEPLSAIGDVLTNMQSSLVSAERAFEVLDLEPDIRDRPDAITLEHVQGVVAFEGVTFSYQPGPPVLHDVSFTVRPGEVVALVGPTGAGKTTVASLVCRFYDPAVGRVTLDGHDLRDLTVRTLRENVAVVLQEPILFSGSIRHNIAYGRPDATFDQIVAAATAANAHEFISELPDGYDTLSGERGVRLSGGERQRIALARAFLKDAPVLILDEPTSSIDSQTEQVIVEALERLMVGRTTFIIAHRLATIGSAGQILVLDQGRVVERGHHDELMQQGGLYAQLYDLQSQVPASAAAPTAS